MQSMERTANTMAAQVFGSPWLGRVGVAYLLAAGLFVVVAPHSGRALELRDEPATIANERVANDDQTVGEDVGEPAEDAPVEGEPRAGEAPDLPTDDAIDPSADPAAGTGDGQAADPDSEK
jgi:hypothetical protein